MIRWVTCRFVEEILAQVKELSSESILDVGCGEGYVTRRLAEIPSVRKVVGLDREPEVLKNTGSNKIGYVVGDAYNLDYPPNSFDTVIATEVLEHLREPERALHSMSVVSARNLAVTVPREPLWRMLNMVRMKYLRDWGNTPGHIQHFSDKKFRQLMEKTRRLHGYSELNIKKKLIWNIAVLTK